MHNRQHPSQSWAADTGCYSQPEQFDVDQYLGWLASRDLTNCLFACAPDVVYKATETLERSRDVLPRIRALGIRAALVAQDGLEDMLVPWHTFDVLFLGGTTDWKLGEGAAHLAAEAALRGKWVHMGRVNSRKRIFIADALGCDSVDGTLVAFGPSIHIPRLKRWMEEVNGK